MFCRAAYYSGHPSEYRAAHSFRRTLRLERDAHTLLRLRSDVYLSVFVATATRRTELGALSGSRFHRAYRLGQ